MPLSPQQAQVLAQQLLDEEEVAGESPAVSAPAQDTENQGLPQRIGSYRIVGVIASGGMGVVYQAEQEHPRRVVALKVLKRGLTSPSALRRFEHEAQVLARLRHDGIAHIYDAGTHDDPGAPGEPVPYFVMEFIPNARSIVQFAQDHKLSLRGRLELFADTCDAVHHGHQKGIIHRDLKPAKILVEGTDHLAPGDNTGGLTSADTNRSDAPKPAKPRVKIIDFGIARATDADVALTTLQTDVRELIGTLQYMSPEQVSGGVEGDPHDLDIRSDIYSLGVVLYELLTGHLPYDLSHKSLPSATRTIAEANPPPPSSFVRKLHGDLEAILLKTLQKDREKRYQSAMDLCRDVRRYLQGEPIEARAPSRWSLTMRWVTRHPIVTTTAACLTIAGLTLAATFGSIWYLKLRPYTVELTVDGREARLVSVAGETLHTWRSETDNGIWFAELVERPPELGGGKLAIIGFSQDHKGPVSGSLCAFPATGDRTMPMWVRRIAENDLPTGAKDHGYKADAFGVKWCNVQDVFPGPKHPGLEMIADYQHGPGSACAVRIYDLNGELLYQIWHDGSLGRGYWMSEPGLLVLCGLNSEAYWAERGHPDVKEAHPIVLFALRPQLGHIGTRITTPSPGGDTATLAWYKCLLPPASSDLFRNGEVTAPLPEHDPAYLVRFSATLATNPPAGRLSWVLDQTGAEVPGTRQTTDQWKLDPQAPDPAAFHFGDLPPINPTDDR